MIYIEGNKHDVLPDEFIFSHNFCVNLYDSILKTIRHDTFKELYINKIEIPTLNRTVDIDDLKSDGYKLLDWLKENNKNELIISILSKQILTSVVPDMLQFIYEGLSCLMRGKTTVALSNFRKPINENLVILERLYHDKTAYIDDFYFNSDNRKFDPSNNKLDKIIIITEVLKKFKNPVFNFLNADLIYDLRFSKDTDGLNPRFNKAIHIVTNDSNYRTESTNFNYTFDNKDDIYNQWKYIYNHLPYLLIYITNLVLYLTDELIDVDSKIIESQEFKVLAGSLCWFENANIYKETLSIFLKMSNEIDLECPKCGTKANLDISDFRLIYETGIRPCVKCFSSIIPYSKEFMTENYIEN